MKNLQEYIKESLLDDFDTLDKNLNDSIEKEVKKWILDNYQVTPSSLKILKRPNKDGKLIVNASHAIFNSDSKSLTNGMFVWGKIKDQFVCSRSFITSLEGAPQYVGGFFHCSRCDSLKSLKGSPEKVGNSFYCNGCNSLKSLEGAPKEVDGSFCCDDCDNLKSLEGAPKEVSGGFYCYNCKSLKSLKGAPEKVGANFDCSRCNSLKSIDIPSTTKIKGKIIDK